MSFYEYSLVKTAEEEAAERPSKLSTILGNALAGSGIAAAAAYPLMLLPAKDQYAWDNEISRMGQGTFANKDGRTLVGGLDLILSNPDEIINRPAPIGDGALSRALRIAGLAGKYTLPVAALGGALGGIAGLHRYNNAYPGE